MTALPIFCITSSSYSLVSMAVERYRAICLTDGKISFGQAKVINVSIWILSVIVSIPTAFEYTVYLSRFDLPGNQTEAEYRYPADPSTLELNGTHNFTYINVCGSSLKQTYGISNGVFLLLMAYIVPLVTICVCYFRLIMFIIRQTKQQQTTHTGETQLMRKKLKIIKMLVIVAILFALCWLPYFSFLIVAVSKVGLYKLCEFEMNLFYG